MWRIGLCAIFALSIFLYLPTLMGGAVWDDVELISGSGFGGNNIVNAFTKPFLGHYFRPLTSASFVLDSSFAKSTPFFYHQTNILLHAFTAILIACLGLAITRRTSAGILAGLFFAAQPMQVGATAWIGGRTDVLSALFLAAFMLSLVTYHQTSKKPLLVVSTLMFFLAAITKEQAFAVLPAVPLSVYVFGTRKKSDAFRICIPFAIAAIAFVGLWAIDAPFPTGAKTGLANMIEVGLRTTALYAISFLVPNNKSLVTFTLENFQGAVWIVLGAAVVAASVSLFWILWKRNRSYAWLAVCAFLVYLPISNFPAVATFVVAPYRCAEAGTAVACLLGAGFGWALANRRIVFAIPFAANLIAGAIVTWWGIHCWTSEAVLFDQVAHTDGHFIVGVTHYAEGLDTEHKQRESLRWTGSLLTWVFGTEKWHEAINSQGQHSLTKPVMARLHTNSGLPDPRSLGWLISNYAGTLSHMQKTPEAILIERDALIVSPGDPRINFAYGQLVVKTDRQDAIRHWEFALRVSPRFANCAAALAHERLVDHRFADVVKLLEPNMAELDWNSDTWIDLADAKIGLRDYAGALKALDGAGKSLFVRKDKVAERIKLIKELQSGSSDRQQESKATKEHPAEVGR